MCYQIRFVYQLVLAINPRLSQGTKESEYELEDRDILFLGRSIAVLMRLI